MKYRALAVFSMLTALLWTSQALAQRGRGGGGKTGFSALNFNYEYISGAGLALEPELELEVTTLEARLNLPPIGMRHSSRVRERKDAGGWLMLHGLEYHQRKINYGNPSLLTTTNHLDRVHGIGYDFSLIYRPSRKWRMAFQVKPGVYGDLEGDIDSDHWNVKAALIVDRVLNSGFVIGIGAGRSAVFGRDLPLPLLHLESRMGSNPRVRVFLPTLAECSWRIESGIELGAAARLNGDRYALGEFETADQENPIDRLRYSNLTVGPFVSFRVGRGWTLMLEGGGTVYRRFETTLEDVVIDDYALNNTSYFRLSLRAGR